MKDKANLYKLIYTKLPALLFILTIYTAIMPELSFGKTVHFSNVIQDEFAKKFREGRDLIDSEDWTKAAEKFAEITSKYPGNKSVDAALYWQAFCYKKQRKFPETRAAVDRLIKDFPNSSWVSDAKVLLLDFPSQNPRTAPNRTTIPSRTANSNLPLDANDKLLDENNKLLDDNDKLLDENKKLLDESGKTSAEREKLFTEREKLFTERRKLFIEREKLFPESTNTFAGTADIYALLGKSFDEMGRSLDESGRALTADFPLDDNPIERADEIKLAAFQNFFASDSKKAIELAGDVLQKDSKASEILKRQIVRTFRRSRFVKTQLNGTAYQYVRATTNIGKEFVPLLKEVLKKGFQTESNAIVRNEIIYALADMDDPESVEYLIQTYNSTNDVEIKKTIIFSFGSPALSLSGTFRGTKITAEPLSANDGYNLNFEKLMEMVSTEKDPELRRAAFVTVQRFIRQSTNEGAIEKIARLYDAETDESFKISIINFFTNLNIKKATAKLMDIAKNDKNNNLKVLAAYALRTSKDPAVIKFLQSLNQ